MFRKILAAVILVPLAIVIVAGVVRLRLRPRGGSRRSHGTGKRTLLHASLAALLGCWVASATAAGIARLKSSTTVWRSAAWWSAAA